MWVVVPFVWLIVYWSACVCWLVVVGVVCENCIVDASILFFVCVCFVCVLGYSCVFCCLRAHGGCLGMLSR